jgi:uncharacterized membrane protein YcaP (DUF421 family)
VFHLHVGAPEAILRAVLIYLVLVVASRLFGKREFGQMNTLDFVVLRLIANAKGWSAKGGLEVADATLGTI